MYNLVKLIGPSENNSEKQIYSTKILYLKTNQQKNAGELEIPYISNLTVDLKALNKQITKPKRNRWTINNQMQG